MRIEVTAEDIAKGLRLNACECPVALALRRAGLVEPAVYPPNGPDDYSPGHNGWIRHGAFADVQSGELPPAAARFALAFDEGKPVEPFSFDLDVTP